MCEVFIAAAPIATKQSAVIICVSKNQAWVKPSSSARCASFQESLRRGDADAEIHAVPPDLHRSCTSPATMRVTLPVVEQQRAVVIDAGKQRR